MNIITDSNNIHMQSAKQNIDNASIQDMIALLKEYEKNCLDKYDFSSAQEAKNKIEFLRSQQILLRRQRMDQEDKENIENIAKKGQQQIKQFQQHWDQKLQQLIESLKEVEKNLEQLHQKELTNIITKLEKQQIPKMKFSSEILDLRKYLRNLIKVKNYKEAEIVKNKLEQKEKEEQEKWMQKHEQKKKIKLENVKRKQQNELNALRIKAEATFNENIKERDHKFQILLKKNRKRRIESGKVSRERLKTKTALLNESKSYMTISKN